MINCIIIEDEQRTSRYLIKLLEETEYPLRVLAEIESIKEAVAWLKENKVDLIFMDVQLSDGLCFDIFDNIQVTTPVIFTTSYDQYMTKAFEVNSVSYLLKPIDIDSLNLALSKYNLLYNKPVHESVNETVIPFHQGYQKRFLVQSGASFNIIPVDEVAYFRVHNKRYVIMVTKQGNQHLLDNTLKMLEKRLDPEKYFRINLQFIVNVEAIRQVHSHDRGRLIIETLPVCKDEMVVSIDRATPFKSWLNK